MSRTSKRTRYGVVADRVDTATRLNSEMAEGAVVYDTDLDVFAAYTENGWQLFSNSNSVTGWADYNDTQFTSAGSAFSIPANTDTIVPHDSGNNLEVQKPSDIESFTEVVPTSESGLAYEHSKIAGRNGDGLIITFECTLLPMSAGTTLAEFWFDIGGSIGELYRRPITFPKGNGVQRKVNFTVAGYNLDTWEANGATVYVRTNGPCDIFSTRYLLTRSHKAN